MRPAIAERAAALLRDSLESAREIGMRGLEERAAARWPLVRALPAAAGRDDDDLTRARSRCCVCSRSAAATPTSRMVLAISLNTVATHVRNILAKTGCANRTEAAAYAMRRGLHRGSEPGRASHHFW